jgi:hypothetical protein
LDLYLEANDITEKKLIDRCKLNSASQCGEMLATLALYADAPYKNGGLGGLVVPTFEVIFDGEVLSWEGTAELGTSRNPGDAHVGWTHVKVRPGWPETWEKKIGPWWYTIENGVHGWHLGWSHRRGDADSVDRGASYASFKAAALFAAEHAGPSHRNPDDFDIAGVTTNPEEWYRVKWPAGGGTESGLYPKSYLDTMLRYLRHTLGIHPDEISVKPEAFKASNPRGIFTERGERMYEEIKESYGSDPRAAELAAKTVYARAREGVTGLLNVGKGRPPGVPNKGR